MTGVQSRVAGTVQLDNGAFIANSVFNETVNFTGSSGVLALGQSQGFASVVSFFAPGEPEVLDLGDIGFISVGEARYAGTASDGVLTLSTGTRTASIKLNSPAANHLNDEFAASINGHGGVDVISTVAGRGSTHPFTAARAELTTGGGGPLLPPTGRQSASLPFPAPGHGLGE